MQENIDPRGQDNPSQYVVEDRSSNPELIRLMIQDSLMTTGMGGPLAEQANPTSLHRVLDIGCGSGGWISLDRKSTRLNSSHTVISYAVFCLKKKKKQSSESTTSRILHMSASQHGAAYTSTWPGQLWSRRS